MSAGKATAASKSHREAERRRRGRINENLATLNKLLPGTTKVRLLVGVVVAKFLQADKASILAGVIQHIKRLKEQVAEISTFWPVPSEADELNVHIDRPTKLLKASICCNDRPGLLSELGKTLKTLRLETIKAEMATLDGRIKNVFLMSSNEGHLHLLDDDTLAAYVADALKAVMEGTGLKRSATKCSR